MELTKAERERITDSSQMIQAARASLQPVDKSKIPDGESIEECLNDAEENLRKALGYRR